VLFSDQGKHIGVGYRL